MVKAGNGYGYDVVVVGAGHAGAEAALAAARMGCRTLCLALSLDSVAHMPCNPSIGGPAKGHLVREVDALGGQMGVTTDKTLVQLKLLNTSKGPAVRALRAQVDKPLYHLAMKRALESEPGLELRQLVVVGLLVEGGAVRGVICRGDIHIEARAVVLTTGTYLSGRVFIGTHSHAGGPNGQLAPEGLGGFLRSLGLDMARFKTGTPPRLNGHTVDKSRMVRQEGDELEHGFSFLRLPVRSRLLPCHLTYTNEATHDIIRRNLDRAPMFTGAITGKGPRYCPSIESKVVAFPDKTSHQLFLEPEGTQSDEYYLGGFSTSLPEQVQDELIKTIPGLESAKVLRYGYAIEYDVVLPYQLTRWLEVKEVRNLFTAGQVNGTSGYEEAAAQGLLAGVNAAMRSKGKAPVTLERHEAYIGVLVDDLVTKGPEEPYRMLTTMAEYRVLLRHDNADERLTPIGREWGLVTDDRMALLERKQSQVNEEMRRLSSVSVPDPAKEDGTRVRLSELLRRPGYTYDRLTELGVDVPSLPDEVRESVEISLKYSGYIERQLEQAERVKRHGSKSLEGVDFRLVPGLSSEAREKLCKFMPDTLGQAVRIAGVSSADATALMLYLMKAAGRAKGGDGR